MFCGCFLVGQSPVNKGVTALRSDLLRFKVALLKDRIVVPVVLCVAGTRGEFPSHLAFFKHHGNITPRMDVLVMSRAGLNPTKTVY